MAPPAFGAEPASGEFMFGTPSATGTTDSTAGGGFTFGDTTIPAATAGGLSDDAKEKGAVEAAAKGASEADATDAAPPDDGPNFERRDSVGASKLFDFEGGSGTNAWAPVPKSRTHLMHLTVS